MDKEDIKKTISTELPLVSIITPSYNQELFIMHTIISVKNQDYPHVEHIIVDGGSTDGTLDIIRSFEGTYNMRWVSGKDEGQYDAINKGFRIARGEILGYINSDDMYLPGVISKVVNCFNSHKNIDIVYGDWHKIDEKGSLIRILKRRVRPFSLKWLRRYDYINPSATFIRASIISEGFFIDNSLSHVGDWEWYLRIAKNGKKFYFLDEKLCYFREHMNSKTSKLRKEEKEKQIRIVCTRHRIPVWKQKFWENFLLAWRGRFFYFNYLLKNHNWSEIFWRSKRILLRYLENIKMH